MFKQLLDDSTLLPVAGMLFFFAVFAAVLIRVMSRKRRQHYDHMSRLPLDSEGPENAR